MMEFCICSAIRMPDGEVIHGHRHDNCYDVVRNRADRLDVVSAEQGFVTSLGRFVGREQAMEIQKRSGRPSKYSKDGRYRGERLFSEDLY